MLKNKKVVLPEDKHYTVRPLIKAFSHIHPQLFQNFAIGFILLFGGKYWGYVNIDWFEIFVVFFVVSLTDIVLHYIKEGKLIIPLSAINTGIGICFFLRTDVWQLYALAGLIAILSKHLIQINGKHFFNPSYSAVLLIIILFPVTAYTNPLQWGGEPHVLGLITALGLLVMARVGLLDMVLGFMGSFLALIFAFTAATWDDIQILYFTGSFFIVSFFGLTDPAIVPKSRLHRFLYVFQVALWFFLLRLFVNENYALFLGYFLVNFTEIFLWKLEQKTLFGYNARTVVQGALTLLLFLLVANASYNHARRYNGVWPELLTNRCNQLICDRKYISKERFKLLLPFFLVDIKPVKPYTNDPNAL